MTKTTKKNENENTAKKATSKRRIPRYSLNIVTMLLAVLALINSEWAKQQTHYLNKSALSQQSKEASKNQAILANRIKKMVAEENKIKAQVQETTKKTNLLSKKTNTMSELLNQALHSDQQKKNHFKLLESHHLLTLAELTLNWQQNIPGTITLLEGIDNNLAGINRLDTNSLRQIIHHTISDLKAIKPVDKVSLFGQLSALERQSESIKFIQAKLSSKDNLLKPSPSQAESDSPLESAWQKTLSSLSKVVILKHNSKPYQPHLSNADMDNISHSIVMNLEQAGWALLRNKQELYDYSLEKAKTLIETYFETSHQAKSMIASIEALKTVQLNPKLPALSPIASTLESLIQAGDNT